MGSSIPVHYRRSSVAKRYTFPGGIVFRADKASLSGAPVIDLPPPGKVVIPLLMHRGRPARVCVRLGEYVKMGQIIAEAEGPHSCAVHASVSGRVTAVDSLPHPSGRLIPSVEIENNGLDAAFSLPPLSSDWRECAPAEITARAAEAGLLADERTGEVLGPILAAFQSRKAETLIINICESDPADSARLRLATDRCSPLLIGAAMLRKAVGAPQCILCVEETAVELIALIQAGLNDGNHLFEGFTLLPMRSRFPQDTDVLLVSAALKKEIAPGHLAQNGIVVAAAEAAVRLHDAVISGTSFFERIVSITGAGVPRPGNYRIRIGTPVRYILEAADIHLDPATKKVIAGGLMRGIALPDCDVPLLRTTTTLVISTETFPAERGEWCIRCGECARLCPMRLLPERIAAFTLHHDYAGAAAYHPERCIECGICSHVCPSRINLLNLIELTRHMTAPEKDR